MDIDSARICAENIGRKIGSPGTRFKRGDKVFVLGANEPATVLFMHGANTVAKGASEVGYVLSYYEIAAAVNDGDSWRN